MIWIIGEFEKKDLGRINRGHWTKERGRRILLFRYFGQRFAK